MKRTCNGCRAYSSTGCDLRYKTKVVYKELLGVRYSEHKPDEECPKPKTYTELLNNQ